LLRHARAGELWFLKEKPGPAPEASGKDAPTEELARDEKNALENLVVSVSDACLRCVRALHPPPDPDPVPRERSQKTLHFHLGTTRRPMRLGKGTFRVETRSKFSSLPRVCPRVRARSSLTQKCAVFDTAGPAPPPSLALREKQKKSL
jgi:hypothetical protein